MATKSSKSWPLHARRRDEFGALRGVFHAARVQAAINEPAGGAVRSLLRHSSSEVVMTMVVMTMVAMMMLMTMVEMAMVAGG